MNIQNPDFDSYPTTAEGWDAAFAADPAAATEMAARSNAEWEEKLAAGARDRQVWNEQGAIDNYEAALSNYEAAFSAVIAARTTYEVREVYDAVVEALYEATEATYIASVKSYTAASEKLTALTEAADRAKDLGLWQQMASDRAARIQENPEIEIQVSGGRGPRPCQTRDL